MSEEFRYSLTRLCIRSGRMTLPQKLIDLFPQEGEVQAVDTVTGKDLLLQVVGPRQIAGLDDFFAEHELDVNDEIGIRKMDEGRLGLTPLLKHRREDRSPQEAGRRLIDRLLELGAPVSEAEIRSLEPRLPADLDISELLEGDGRFVRKGGRWAVSSEEDWTGRAPQPPSGAAGEQGTGAGESDSGTLTAGDDELEQAKRPGSDSGQAEDRPSRWFVTRYTKSSEPAPAGLNSAAEDADVTLMSRARQALLLFGFKVEGLPRGQLLAAADMGRKSYSVLVQLFPERARLDWSALLSKRRESGATYLAVFGHQQDLIRVSAPAEMARATLWPWESLERAQELVRSVPVSPFDVEPYFQQGGLFDNGIVRFEKGLGRRIAERGAFSTVLTRLAALKAPAVFMLDDVVDEGNLSREQALRVLELLSQAPFHLVVKVADGEFCVRQDVGHSLRQLSDYALSLRDRMPTRKAERLKASIGADEAAAVKEVEDAKSAKVEGSG